MKKRHKLTRFFLFTKTGRIITQFSLNLFAFVIGFFIGELIKVYGAIVLLYVLIAILAFLFGAYVAKRHRQNKLHT